MGKGELMKCNFRSLLKPQRFNDRGYALPFALFVLSITAIFTAAGLWLVESLVQRVETRIDVLHARDLAHAGVASEIELLVNGKNPQTLYYQNSDGGCFVNGNKVVGTTGIFTIVANANTNNGAKSTATVSFDLFRQRIEKWSETP